MKRNLIYFDNAATGYPKPRSVIRAVNNAFSKFGGNPGRSGHTLSVDASRMVYGCRETICDFLNYKYPERVVFTPNASFALNLAIFGLYEKNSNIIISDLEHNSVIRPVYALVQNESNNITYTTFSAAWTSDELVISDFTSKICENTKLAVITYVSNICGRILPVEKISRICKEKNIRLIIDASQGCGEIPINLEELYFDAFCSAGHKGLYGPAGTGFVIFSKDCEPENLIFGGNGINSEIPYMSGDIPERLEVGTLNTVGICGLCEGIKFIDNLGVSSIHESCSEIRNYIEYELQNMGVAVYGDYTEKTPIILFNVPGFDASQVSSCLDDYGICTRSGLHCAPSAHKALFTGNSGAVRASLGYANTMSEAQQFIKCVNNFIKTNR